MSTIEELSEAVKETLSSRGVMADLKARVRAEIFSALDDSSVASQPPALTNENLLINELIRDYMDYNGYRHSSSVLVAESGQPRERLEREFIARELGVAEDAQTRSVPLLYSLLEHFLRRARTHTQTTTAAAPAYTERDTPTASLSGMTLSACEADDQWRSLVASELQQQQHQQQQGRPMAPLDPHDEDAAVAAVDPIRM